MITLFDRFKKWQYAFLGIGFTVFAFILPALVDFFWLDMIAKVRESIVLGDSGPLVMASAIYSLLNTAQNLLTFMAAYAFTEQFFSEKMSFFSLKIICVLILFYAINYFVDALHLITWDAFASVFSAIIVMLLIKKPYHHASAFYRTIIIAILVFFAFQWLNLMPMFSSGEFGRTDIPVSIKIASQYLQSETVMNFVGFAFFIPLFLSALVTSTLFDSFDRNIAFAEENHSNAIMLETLRAKALEQRVNLEITSIAHDLKTPLVTIRGLNSLLALSKDEEKLITYTDRIDSAVEKMSDMISGFLYETSKKPVKVDELILYIRAQIPISDDKLRIEVEQDTDLPELMINKIRVARAITNLIDNAINAPNLHETKIIRIRLYREGESVFIEVIDNGSGISEDKIHDIWDLGYSDSNSTGLGLHFVKRIMEENDGIIEMHSQKNVGTTVKMKFPIYER